MQQNVCTKEFLCSIQRNMIGLLLLSSLITPQEALEKLIDGNHRFASEALEHPNRSREDRLATAEGQMPFAVIVGCSDSRVSPDILFDQGIGDLFTVRVAGNVIGPIELDSIHYSALYLGSSLILVLGHEGCGAIHAVLDGKSDQIEAIARYVAPSIKKAKHDHKDRGGILECSIKDNICYGVRLLRKNRALARLIKEEKLAIVGGYYHFETGLVELLDDAEW